MSRQFDCKKVRKSKELHEKILQEIEDRIQMVEKFNRDNPKDNRYKTGENNLGNLNLQKKIWKFGIAEKEAQLKEHHCS